MAIVFQCPHCNKKIEAQDSTVGKWARCPGCKEKVLVPTDVDDLPLRLAPLDEVEEDRRRRLVNEAYSWDEDILRDKPVPTSNDDPPPPAEAGGVVFLSMPEMDAKELTSNIVRYLRLMSDGHLEEASTLLDVMIPYRSQSLGILDRIALSQDPQPGLAAIPRQVLAALIRNLRQEIQRAE